jgi:NADPH2:quinone reductase
MRAVQITQPGGPEALEVREVAPVSPGVGEVAVKVHAAGVNYIDTYHRSGTYPLPLPYTLGQEGAGEITALGEGVSQWSIGERVCWSMAPGSYAEVAVVPANKLVVIPDGISFEIAAAALLQGLTAHYLVTSVYPVDGSTRCVVHAAAGGVGLLLTQMITDRGGFVIGTTSSDDKAALVRLAGAAHVIRYDQVDWAAEVSRITDGAGVDVVYDGVGKDTFEGSLASLRPRGLLALYGASSGQVPPFDLQRLGAMGSIVVTRPSLAHFIADASELTWRSQELFIAIVKGALDIRIAARFSLDDAGEAHRAIQSRRYSGKILLIP